MSLQYLLFIVLFSFSSLSFAIDGDAFDTELDNYYNNQPQNSGSSGGYGSGSDFAVDPCQQQCSRVRPYQAQQACISSCLQGAGGGQSEIPSETGECVNGSDPDTGKMCEVERPSCSTFEQMTNPECQASRDDGDVNRDLGGFGPGDGGQDESVPGENIGTRRPENEVSPRQPAARKTSSRNSQQDNSTQGPSCDEGQVIVDGECVSEGVDDQAVQPNPDPNPPPSVELDPETKYSEAINQCTNSYKKSASCCNNPIGCMAESAGLTEDGSNVSSGMQFASQFAAMFAASGAGSQSRACGALQSLGVFTSGVNVAAASQCMSSINQCRNSCEPIAQQLEIDYQNCLSDDYCRSNKIHRQYQALKIRVRQKTEQCELLTAKAETGMVQASQAAAGAMLANKCKQAASATNTASTGFDNVDTGVFNTNCSDPANISNPICQNNCQRPGAANDPMCRQILGLEPAGGGAGTSNPAADAASMSADGSNAFGLNEDLDENGEFEGVGIQSTANSTDAKSQSGGGVPGGGGGGGAAMGSGGGSGARRGVASGNRGKILKGYASGGGYSARAGRSRYSGGGGGFSGYGNGKAAAKRGGKKFNLADYLPGNKLDPRKRKIASVLGLKGAAANQIGRASENIFEKISNRFYSICLGKRLMDCDKVVRPMRHRGR